MVATVDRSLDTWGMPNCTLPLTDWQPGPLGMETAECRKSSVPWGGEAAWSRCCCWGPSAGRVTHRWHVYLTGPHYHLMVLKLPCSVLGAMCSGLAILRWRCDFRVAISVDWWRRQTRAWRGGQEVRVWDKVSVLYAGRLLGSRAILVCICSLRCLWICSEITTRGSRRMFCFSKCTGRKVTRETSGFNLLTWVAIVPKYFKSGFGVAERGRTK